MSYITATELDRVLDRAQGKDPLGVKIAAAIALIEGVLDDYGYVAPRCRVLTAGNRPWHSPLTGARTVRQVHLSLLANTKVPSSSTSSRQSCTRDTTRSRPPGLTSTSRQWRAATNRRPGR